MGKKSKKEKIELYYKINRKEIINTSIKKFYQNKIAIFIGPIMILLGFMFTYKHYTMGIYIINLGLIITVFPYILIFVNFRRIKNIEVKLTIFDDIMLVDNGHEKASIKYKYIGDIEKDDFFIRIEPNEISQIHFKNIIIPLKSIYKGEPTLFLENLTEKVKQKNISD